jgi:hypothetical protein
MQEASINMQQPEPPASAGYCIAYFSTLKIEAVWTFETLGSPNCMMLQDRRSHSQLIFKYSLYVMKY